MRSCRLVPAMSLAALLPACALIVDGNTQAVSISTAPPGATCTARPTCPCPARSG